MNEILTEHHLLPKSKNGSNIPENIQRLKQSRHVAFHKIFENRTPVEQLQYLLAFNKCLHPEAKAVIQTALNEVGDNRYTYKNGVLRPKEF